MTINIDIAMEIPKSMIHFSFLSLIHFSFLSHEPPSLKYSTKYPMMYSDLHDIDYIIYQGIVGKHLVNIKFKRGCR